MNQIIIAAVVAFALGWFVCSRFNEADKVAQANAMLAYGIQNAEVIAKLQGEKHEADNVVDDLLGRKPSLVRLPAATCETNPASGGLHLAASCRLLSEQAERVLDADRQRTQVIIGECEHSVNYCRVVVEWAASIGK